MAPYGQAVGYDWDDDLSEANNAAMNGMLLSNHSYGYDSFFYQIFILVVILLNHIIGIIF
jgi:hypothetical protein